MNREGILEAMRSLARKLGRVPGENTFRSYTGISRSEMWNLGFAKYSEAVEAAGLEPNRLQVAFNTSELLAKLAVLTRQLGKFPTKGDLKVARSKDGSIPSYEAYVRLGEQLYNRIPGILLKFCHYQKDFADVIPLVESRIPSESVGEKQSIKAPQKVAGYVYLAKHGQDYRVGRSNDVVRRGREISLILPQELEHVHIIETDDPPGIERYWHERFKDRRIRGEWFRLTREDVAAF